MLDQLVESNNHTKENRRRGGFLITTFFVICSIFASGILWSLFAKDLGMNTGNLEMSALVAPLATVEEQPKLPEIQPKNSKLPAPNADMRKDIIQDISESPTKTPLKVSNEKSNVPPRNPNNLTIVGDSNITAANSAAYNSREATDSTGVGLGNPSGTTDGAPDSTVTKVPPPPPPFVKKEDVKPKPPVKISLGVINGKASNLVTPPYPLAARAVHAAGIVNVQVTIDEKGNVIAANAVDGHPLLRQAAENAAKASKFNPTKLSNEPVKVSGLIVYKFAAQ